MNTAEQNREIANTILQQVGTFVRGCLDMGRNCYAIENGVIAKNAIVGHTEQRMTRGDIEITLNGNDLYDIKLTRTTKAKGAHVIKEWNDVFASDLRSTLDSIWR
jgi:hypothetical protein